MEAVETGLKLLLIIAVIYVFFIAVRFLVNTFLVDFYRQASKKISGLFQKNG